MSFPASFNLADLDGSNGFVINGINVGDVSGRSVSNAGDINGDGFDDVLIGAQYASPNGNVSAGDTYIVFGTAQGFDSSLDLSSLDGNNGFVLNGTDAFDYSGSSVSAAGDINGDGFDDILIGAYGADPNGNILAGETYVVFGTDQGFDSSFELDRLDGNNGFMLYSIDDAFDDSGSSVSTAGDINGDGFDDILIGAAYASPNGQITAGKTYVVFGTDQGFDSSFELDRLNGNNGFVLHGIDSGDRSGWSVSAAGDVNGDGFDDILIGAYWADPNGNGDAGETYVVFGTAQGFASSFELDRLDGNNGFVLHGIDIFDYSGWSVSTAGDVNGDGFDDILIGALYADPNSNSNAGETYVIFGTDQGFDSSVELDRLDGSNGFVLKGVDSSAGSGRSVSNAGDINGDGFDDILIGAPSASPDGRTLAGKAYVVFGTDQGFDTSLELDRLDGSNGFVINGIDGGEYFYYSRYHFGYHGGDAAGRSVSAAGDINGDGFDDILIGAPGSAPNGSMGAGETYVIFGRASNRAPVAIDDAVTTDEDSILRGNVLLANSTSPDSDPDNNSLSITAVNGNDSVVGAPIALDNGLLTVNVDGTFSFNPNNTYESLAQGESAQESFTYTLSDGSLTDTATVNITINGVNDAPVANDDNLTGYIAQGVSTTISATELLGDDTDVDTSDILSIASVGNAADGSTVALDGNGDVVFTSAANFTGDTSFEYSVSDGNGGTDTATVTLRVKRELRGTAGTDNLVGDDGEDVLFGEAGLDSLWGGDGDDDLYGGADADFLYGQGGNDQLFGEAGNDVLLGGDGDDFLSGGAGADILYGGAGLDNLDGGAGNDSLFGDLSFSAEDRFVLRSGDGNDSIYFYNDGQDKFVLEGGLSFGSNSGQVEAISAAFGLNTELRIVGTGEVLATLAFVNANSIEATDFI